MWSFVQFLNWIIGTSERLFTLSNPIPEGELSRDTQWKERERGKRGKAKRGLDPFLLTFVHCTPLSLSSPLPTKANSIGLSPSILDPFPVVIIAGATEARREEMEQDTAPPITAKEFGGPDH